MACSFNIRKNTLKIDNKKKGNYPFANISATNLLILMKFGTVYELPPKNYACTCGVNVRVHVLLQQNVHRATRALFF